MPPATGVKGKPAIIDFRDDRTRTEWNSGKVHPLLCDIFVQSAEFAEEMLKKNLLVTCIWRSEDEEFEIYRTTGHQPSGVHRVWRAIDVHADTWYDPFIQKLADWVNARWIYDPLRAYMKVALWEPHGTGPHLHYQVSEHSIVRPSFTMPNAILPTRQFDAP